MRSVLKFVAAASIAALVAVASIGMNEVPSASAASDYLLKLDGVPGEIEVQSWSWGAVAPRDSASGQATGKRQHKPIMIVKEWDRSSPMLLKASEDGVRYKKATLTRGTYSVTFTDVLITGFQHDGKNGAAPSESVSFTYQKIEMK